MTMTEAWPQAAGPRNLRSRSSAPQHPGSRSRSAILTAAAALASADGLDGPSAGTLAMALGRGWDGGGSRQDLQLAVVAEAGRIFDEEVVQPALAAPAGLGQLAAVCEAFFGHLERHACPGGCFMASAALELGTRAGPVRDMITTLQAQFGELIRGFAVTAVVRNELPAGEDPGRLAFELNGIMLATDTNFVQHEDPAVLDLARQIVRQRLGVAQP
jgi:tetracycline repressor-like protein